MDKKFILMLVIVALLLQACGGAPQSDRTSLQNEEPQLLSISSSPLSEEEKESPLFSEEDDLSLREMIELFKEDEKLHVFAVAIPSTYLSPLPGDETLVTVTFVIVAGTTLMVMAKKVHDTEQYSIRVKVPGQGWGTLTIPRNLGRRATNVICTVTYATSLMRKTEVRYSVPLRGRDPVSACLAEMLDMLLRSIPAWFDQQKINFMERFFQKLIDLFRFAYMNP